MLDPNAPLSLTEHAARARAWLFEAALPLWWERGADHARGGWVDRIGQNGQPLADLPRRARVQARQCFVYAEAGRLGWTGPWAEAVRHGLEALARHRRADGLYRQTVTPDGAPLGDGVDLYDQAFVVFALAAAWRALGDAACRDEALALLARLRHGLAHPTAGFEEAHPRTLPLRSNPHMHLLEALLAWVEAGEEEPFATEARAIVALARESLIDPTTGAIGEYFDGEWRFASGEAGQVREPGHQFEWSYLLGEAGRLLGGDHREAIERLYGFGMRGIDAGRGVAVFALDAAGEVTDGDARLWAQSEWLRAALVLGRHDDAASAAAGLWRFLDVPVPGLWRDRLCADGTFVDEAAPASSFYHLVTGLLPLLALESDGSPVQGGA